MTFQLVLPHIHNFLQLIHIESSLTKIYYPPTKLFKWHTYTKTKKKMKKKRKILSTRAQSDSSVTLKRKKEEINNMYKYINCNKTDINDLWPKHIKCQQKQFVFHLFYCYYYEFVIYFVVVVVVNIFFPIFSHLLVSSYVFIMCTCPYISWRSFSIYFWVNSLEKCAFH